MSDLYIVRWGPAIGDDFSCQVFTTKELMNTFVESLTNDDLKDEEDPCPPEETYSLEVHFVEGKSIDVIPDLGSEEGGYEASNLIAFGSTENVIWRINTEKHR